MHILNFYNRVSDTMFLETTRYFLSLNLKRGKDGKIVKCYIFNGYKHNNYTKHFVQKGSVRFALRHYNGLPVI